MTFTHIGSRRRSHALVGWSSETLSKSDKSVAFSLKYTDGMREDDVSTAGRQCVIYGYLANQIGYLRGLF